MGLLDELDRKNGRRRGLIQNLQGGNRQQHQRLPKAPWGTHWVTPAQAARENKQLQRQVTGLIIAVVGWVVAGIISSSYGLIALAPALIVGVLFTVGGVAIAFSHSDKELKSHAWKIWRE